MARRILLGLAVLVGLYLGVGVIRRFLASDEDRIRALVAGMEQAYNEGRPGSCVAPLAKTWRHEGYSVDREMVLGGLFETARDRDKETHELRSRVALVPDTLVIAVDGDHATLETEATFSRLDAGAWEEAWKLALHAELEKGDDGWKIVRSRHRDLAGTQLGR